MNTTRMMLVAMLVAGSGLTALVTNAQQTGIRRSDVVRRDLGVAAREVIQVRVDSRGRRSAGTRIRAPRSPMSSSARWSINSMAHRR